MARLPNFLVIIRSEKLSGKGQGRGGRGAKKRTFRFGKKNVSFPKVETFRFADYTCKQWTKSRMFYHSGAYQQAVESYAEIQKEMKGNARFMFEYGHALHKLHKPEISNKVLKEALKVSGDPMILNIIGKNEQEMKHYDSAEYWFMRAVHRLPGRIYPYYLLAHLYAEPAFYQCDKLEQMVQTVLEKEPKVQSTAIKQMRRKARELLKKVPEN